MMNADRSSVEYNVLPYLLSDFRIHWGATSGTGTVYPSSAPEFTPVF